VPQEADTKEVYEFGPLRLHGEDGSLWRDGRRVPLPPKTADLLLILVQNSGKLLSRDQLKTAVWKETNVEPANLNYQIHVLRRVLQQEFDQQCIQTVAHRGFRFIAPVSIPADPLDASALERVRPPAEPAIRAGDLSKARTWSFLGIGGGILGLLVLGLLASLWVLVSRSEPAIHVLEYKPLTDDRNPKDPVTLLISSDHVYYREKFGAKVFYSVPVGGGEPAPVFQQASEFALFDVSSKRAEYLAGRQNGTTQDVELWAVPMTFGVPRRRGNWSQD